MIDIEEFASGYEENQAELLIYLHDLITSFPNMQAKISYRIPFYYGKSWICYTNPLKKGGVELAFVRGNEMVDEDRVLESRGRKQVRGIIYESAKHIDEQAMIPMIIQAIDLDRTTPYRGPNFGRS